MLRHLIARLLKNFGKHTLLDDVSSENQIGGTFQVIKYRQLKTNVKTGVRFCTVPNTEWRSNAKLYTFRLPSNLQGPSLIAGGGYVGYINVYRVM